MIEEGEREWLQSFKRQTKGCHTAHTHVLKLIPGNENVWVPTLSRRVAGSGRILFLAPPQISIVRLYTFCDTASFTQYHIISFAHDDAQRIIFTSTLFRVGHSFFPYPYAVAFLFFPIPFVLSLENRTFFSQDFGI